MRHRLRPGFVLLGLALSSLVLSSLVLPGRAHADTLRFGAILPLTGAKAITGAAQLRGLQFAADEANAANALQGNTVALAAEDEQPDLAHAVEAFGRLTSQQHVPVVFVASTETALSLAPFATTGKVLLVNAAAETDTLATASPYLFNAVPTFGRQVKALSRYLVGTGKKQAAILFQNDPTGAAERDAFVTYAPEAGGTILSQDWVQPGQTDYRPALTKLAAAEPDVLLVSRIADPLSMAQQYRRLGLPFAVAGIAPLNATDTSADSTQEGFIDARIPIALPPGRAADFRQRFGSDMDRPAALYDNAMQMILTVAGRLLAKGKEISGESMRNTLLTIGTFQTPVPLTFRSNTAAVPLDIRVIKNGDPVTVEHTTTN